MSTRDYESDADSTLTFSHEDLPWLRKLQFTKVANDSYEHRTVARAFTQGMTSMADVEVLSVHKNAVDFSYRWSSKSARAAVFNITEQAVANACGGDANVKHAWYGGSLQQISQVLSFGFCGQSFPLGGRKYGHGIGVYLSPLNRATDYLKSSTPDENGHRYMLLCRVILGRTEKLPPGSVNFFPSSTDYHSGTDDTVTPRRYVVWYCNMNTHIFPEFVLCFRSSSSDGSAVPAVTRKPSSPSVRLDVLLSMLKDSLDADKMAMVLKLHSNFRRNKLSRARLIRYLRCIAGDGLLVSIIKRCNSRQ